MIQQVLKRRAALCDMVRAIALAGVAKAKMLGLEAQVR